MPLGWIRLPEEAVPPRASFPYIIKIQVGEVVIEQFGELLRAKRLRQGGEVTDVAHPHCHLPSLSAQLRLLAIGEVLLAGCLGIRRINGRLLAYLCEVVSYFMLVTN
jgi:hypothetical protein